MAKRVSVDRWLFGVTMLMVFAGLMMVFSASAIMAKERFGSESSFLVKQGLFALIGLAAMFALMKVDYRKLNSQQLVFVTLGVTSLLLAAVFLLDRSHNTHRWIKLGFFSLQPAELAKPAIILFMAHFLESRLRSIADLHHTILPAIAPTGVFCLLIVAQPDLGTAMTCAFITAAILYVAGIETKYFGYALALAVVPMYFLLFRTAWRARRMVAFVNPFADPQGAGFHIIQSLIAVGTGGLTGLGLMEGKQKLFYLPEPQTDFIFAVVCEELGMIGAVLFVAAFAFFCFRGFRVAWNTRDNFARLLAVGITAMIGIQAFFNISVVLGLLPTKGIPLPFVSYGGSSLIVTLACVGVLLNITQQTD
ncbi:MAG: putative lipid II flippase FtsW [Acidobacteria bacterium]|mgnify:CR=1 FL=1|nr:MAG: putative lipid II flippase FtsW [Acidobacteriota bacterium]